LIALSDLDILLLSFAGGGRRMAAGTLLPCPNCQSTAVYSVKFTWWGGVLGPKMLNHTQCTNCNTTYNGKTGKSNTQGIVVYSLVIFAVVFLLYFLFFGGLT